MSINRDHIFSDTTSQIKWSVAVLPKKGESICGDKYIVKQHDNKILLGVIDGLGHGKDAAQASQRTVDLLEDFKDESLITLVNKCHKELRDTRGVVMSLAIINTADNSMSWISIGNIDGILLRRSEEQQKAKRNLVLRGGVVGYKLPMLQASILEVFEGDTLIFTTDGVERDYFERLDNRNTPEEIVEYIARDYFKASDDSLIFVVRYLGG